MKLGWQPRKWLDKKSKLGFRGYPVGTIAFYGPDDQRASKVAVAVIIAPGTEPVALRRWFAENGDVRNDATIFESHVNAGAPFRSASSFPTSTFPPPGVIRPTIGQMRLRRTITVAPAPCLLSSFSNEAASAAFERRFGRILWIAIYSMSCHKFFVRL
jgi:hypothetical protein